MTNFYNEYQRRCNAGGDIHAHLPTLHEYASEAKSVIELGVRGGDSTMAFLAALTENGGHLWSCDVQPPKLLAAWQEAAGDAWTFEFGDDLWAASRAPYDVDVLFIDTSHTYAQTQSELELYADHVRPGGVILLHDTNLKSPADSPASDPDFPVKVAVDEFVAERGWVVKYVKHCNGLGTIQVPEVDGG